MILDTTGIREGHSTIRLTSGLEMVRDNLPSFKELIQGEAAIDRQDGTIVVHLGFSGKFDQQCARCLEMYQHQVSGDIRLILQEADGRSGPANEGETADYFFNSEDFLVDVGPSIYDEVMTSLPLKPLCNESCKGIAIDSKQGVATTNPGENNFDPRWDALRKLQKKTQF